MPILCDNFVVILIVVYSILVCCFMMNSYYCLYMSPSKVFITKTGNGFNNKHFRNVQGLLLCEYIHIIIAIIIIIHMNSYNSLSQAPL